MNEILTMAQILNRAMHNTLDLIEREENLIKENPDTSHPIAEAKAERYEAQADLLHEMILCAEKSEFDKLNEMIQDLEQAEQSSKETSLEEEQDMSQ